MTKTPEELTAEWKAGKLPADDYFIKLINNDITTGFFDGLDFSSCTDLGIFQILAPVPAYDEYRAMQEELTYIKSPNGNYPDRISKLKSRIKHLLDLQENQDKEIEIMRDLLKECKNIVAHDCWQEAQFPDGQVVQRQDLLTRINIAIGESEEQSNDD